MFKKIMKLKSVISWLPVIICVASLSAQSTDGIDVRYTENSVYRNGVKRQRTFHLLANAARSKFFSPRSETIDSLTYTPGGKEKLKEMQKAALNAMLAQGAIYTDKLPTKKENVYVIKNTADSTITFYDLIGSDEPVYYTEPFAEMQWELADSTKTILGYECFKAETDYHGRHWTAWFTPEIPISDGPWKFHGTPGLILEVTDGGDYGYTAVDLGNSNKNPGEVYGADNYTRTDRKKILRAQRAIADNPIGALAAKGIKVTAFKESPDAKKSDFMETDYR